MPTSAASVTAMALLRSCAPAIAPTASVPTILKAAFGSASSSIAGRFSSETVQGISDLRPAILALLQRHFNKNCVGPVGYRLHDCVVNAFIG